MNRYIKVAQAEEVPKNGMKLVKVNQLEVLLININGNFYAIDNRCPHMGYPLFFGRLDGRILRCGFHYADFDIESGKPLNGVTERPLQKIRLKRSNSALLIEYREFP
ncbi:MAG: Rieske (2Fe-2S) protein [Nitrososphaerales archaeon]|nr:Rieske (2Fe-2S) protein [Nitrososphaerales archaeon]